MSDQQSEGGEEQVFSLGPEGEAITESICRLADMEDVQWAQPPALLPECQHYLDLYEQLIKGSEKCLICYTEEEDWESIVPPWITADDEFTGTPLGMVVFEGTFRYLGTEYRRIALGYVVRGIAEFIVSRRLHTIPSFTFHNFPVEAESLRGLVMSKPDQAEHAMLVRAVLCNQTEYMSIVLCPEVPIATKVLSTYLQLYPRLCDQAPASVVQYTYDTFSTRFELDLKGVCDMTKHEKTTHYHALTLIFSLCPAFSRNERLGAQLLARYKSGKQSVSMSVMSESDFMTAFNKCGNVVEDLPGEVLTVIGYCVAITKEKRINLRVLERDLMNAHDAAELLGASRWGQGVYTQVRLVFQRHHLTTMDFAARAMNLVLAHALLYDPAFNAERDALLNAVKIAQDRPYIGLQGTQMEALQIARYPFWAVVGADYHAATLSGKDLEEWKKFNTDGLIKHLQYPYQRDMALKMSQSIPSPFMANALRAAQNDDTIELNRALALLPPNSEEIVYATLAKDPNPGPWYTRKMNVRYNKSATEIKDLILDHVKPDLDQFDNSIETQIKNASTKRAKKILRTYRNKKLKERNDALSKYGARTFQIPVPSEACMQELVTFGRELIVGMKKSANDADAPTGLEDDDE